MNKKRTAVKVPVKRVKRSAAQIEGGIVKIVPISEFRHWVKVQMVHRGMTLLDLSKAMGVPSPRLSEALHGKLSGRKYIPSILEHLNEKERFKSVCFDWKH